MPDELKGLGTLVSWNARQAGLTEDDLTRMTFDEYDAWLEFAEWQREPPDQESDEPSDAERRSETERKFFHL